MEGLNSLEAIGDFIRASNDRSNAFVESRRPYAARNQLHPQDRWCASTVVIKGDLPRTR